MKIIKLISKLILASGILYLCSCDTTTPSADLIISNANIWTGNENQIFAESMAIVNDTILSVGTNEEIEKFKSNSTKLVEMNGAFITPGFIDSHVHLLSGGRSLLSVALRDAATPEEFVKLIADYAATLEKGEWILEGNWDHTLWGGQLPNRDWIDEYTPDNPVVIFRLDGHMVLANTAALSIAGIDEHSKHTESGLIVQNEDGTPTGILKGSSMEVLLEKIPAMNPTQMMQSFKAAEEYFLSNGVTSVHDVDSLSTFDIADQLRIKNQLRVRLYTMRPLYRWKELDTTEIVNNKWVKRGGLKGFVDGSLGSHTAAFHHPYSDNFKDKGYFTHSKDALLQWLLDADKAGFQVMVHAIGDRAIHDLLNIFEEVVEQNGVKDRRLRIEHAQHLDPVDLHRFAELGVIASMQPYHAIDDGRWAEDVIGPERIKTTYAFKSLLDHQATLAFGSDWAVAPASPLLGIYAAVTRRTLDDKNPDGWVPEQKISVEQALKAYTKNAAYASFEEDIKGTLEPGKLADFVVLSDDITSMDPVEIQYTKVLQTYVGGQRVFKLNE